jgi:putative tricarboxylic transport membrane protein
MEHQTVSEAGQDHAEEGRGAAPFTCSSRSGGLVMAALLGAVGAFFASQALDLTFGDVSLPGPGFLPFALGLVLMALSAALFVAALREPRAASRIELGHPPVLIAFACLAASAFLFERVGAYLALGGFTALMLILVARTRIILALLASAGGMAAVWYVFKILLGVQLPAGPLAGLL